MRSGRLRNKITIEQPLQVKNKLGGFDVSWIPFLEKVPAEIVMLKGNEKLSANASWPTADVKITIRYTKGILPTMRIVHKDMIYSILGQPNNVEMRNKFIELTTQSGAKAQ